MAMTKKERAEFDAAISRAEMLAALRWTERVERDLQIPTGGGLSKGFDFNDYWNNPCVEKACSSSVSHAFGQDNQTTSQGPRRLFSTRLRALRALRHALELHAANTLLAVDHLIQQEIKEAPDAE